MFCQEQKSTSVSSNFMFFFPRVESFFHNKSHCHQHSRFKNLFENFWYTKYIKLCLYIQTSLDCCILQLDYCFNSAKKKVTHHPMCFFTYLQKKTHASLPPTHRRHHQNPLASSNRRARDLGQVGSMGRALSSQSKVAGILMLTIFMLKRMLPKLEILL